MSALSKIGADQLTFPDQDNGGQDEIVAKYFGQKYFKLRVRKEKESEPAQAKLDGPPTPSPPHPRLYPSFVFVVVRGTRRKSFFQAGFRLQYMLPARCVDFKKYTKPPLSPLSPNFQLPVPALSPSPPPPGQYPSLPCVRIGSAAKHNYIPMEVCQVSGFVETSLVVDRFRSVPSRVGLDGMGWDGMEYCSRCSWF